MAPNAARLRLALAVLLLAAAVPPARGEGPKKMIILGFDGADANLARRYMDEGKLPNLAKLRQEGTFSPLQSTIPSQTPVSWSTLSTGLSPGRHGIFDFLKRDTKNYKPSFAAFDEGKEPFLLGKKNPWVFGAGAAVLVLLLALLLGKLFRLRTPIAAAIAAVLGLAAGLGVGQAAARLLPVEKPVAFNRQRGETFWAALGKAGKRVTMMRMPVTFPPKPYEGGGRLLSGLGTPDISKRIGKPFYFTSELFFTPRGGGDFSLEVVELVDNKGTIDTEIKGPQDELFGKAGDYVKIPMRLTVPADRSHLGIDVSGNHLELKTGQWSDWVRFTFPFNALIKLHGIGKFKVESLTPEVKLYLSPIEFDPENLPPGFAITTPGDFVHDLTSRFGLFKTKGWMIDTWSVADGTADEQLFLEDVHATVQKDREILGGLLAKQDEWDVLFHYFEFTDRVQHIMYRFLDPKHPLYTADGAAKWGGSVLEAYQEMDRIVGEVVAKMPPGTALFVVSDHGFASFRRGMNYNTWLAKNGYMTLTGEDSKRKNLEDLFDQGDFFVNVDWSKTRAYALGLGQIYLNVKGREAKGIVAPGEEYQKVAAEIRAGLEGFVDPETGEHPVAHVFTRDEAYGTYDPLLIPDLIPSNNAGYRVGWQDSLGGIAKVIVENNTEVWSGDHCSVYPPLVPGILFSNLKLNAQGAKMADITPTLLDLYGVKPAEKLDGRSLVAH